MNYEKLAWSYELSVSVFLFLLPGLVLCGKVGMLERFKRVACAFGAILLVLAGVGGTVGFTMHSYF